ncbi:MAG TPA: lipid-binding SYLF domain-containing protein [Terriglobales bacterium]|nr:lipid-binding SYLF domain-containing protein [Terriglobales bacterium]
MNPVFRKFTLALILLALAALPTLSWGAQDKTDTELRLENATAVLKSILNAPESKIPDEVISGAKCIAVVPHLLKGGFIFGAKRGRGVVTCRLPGGGWSSPAFLTVTGGDWGAQIGVEGIDLVMMFMTEQGARHLMDAKFQIGAEASAAAGPIGRHASAGTDWKVNTQILTYSRAKGAFAGVTIGGSWVQPDADSNEAMYGRSVAAQAILTGKVKAPNNPQVQAFLNTVRTAKMEAKAQTEQH